MKGAVGSSEASLALKDAGKVQEHDNFKTAGEYISLLSQVMKPHTWCYPNGNPHLNRKPAGGQNLD